MLNKFFRALRDYPNGMVLAIQLPLEQILLRLLLRRKLTILKTEVVRRQPKIIISITKLFADLLNNFKNHLPTFDEKIAFGFEDPFKSFTLNCRGISSADGILYIPGPLV